MSPLSSNLMPGDVAVALNGDRFCTLLGSCVSVILTDPLRTVGAMCHIVHAGGANAAHAGNTAYGQPAMDALFSKLLHLGVHPGLCQAYVYGGGNMFPQLFKQHHVGERNVTWVLNFLAMQHISVVGESLGGDGYRKVAWTVGLVPPSVEIVGITTEVQNGH